MAFPSFAWKYVPSSGVPNPPRCPSWHPEPASGAHWVARHWLKLGSAGRAPGARLAFWAGWAFRGFASRWARAGPIGVLVASPRSADGRWWAPSARLPSGHHRRALWRARARLRAARAAPRPGSRRARGAVSVVRRLQLNLLHRMEQDYPLNLSISLSGGKETNRDAPSNGE
jgi:hypothetical protein